MKLTINKIAGVIVLFSITLSSCTKDFTEINTDPNTTPYVLPKQLLAPALVNVMAYNMLRNRNFNNELMQVTVDMGDGEGKVFRYDYRNNWADYLYNGWYSELTNFKDIYKLANTEGALNNKSYMGISLVCQSWIYSLLTDTYGDVPYFQSNKAKPDSGEVSNIEPVFDRQKDIYLDIFKKLEEANTLLTANTPIDAVSDPIYAGNVSRWRKFGNSLYLRLLLRVSGKAEVAQPCKDKIKEIVETKKANYPIIASNDDAAILKWTGTAPYTSPLLTVREQDFRAPGIASFFMDNLVEWADPRIDISLGTNGINRWRIAPASGAFVGVPSGYAPGENPLKKAYFYSNAQTVNGVGAASLMNEPLGGIIMSCAEVNFILTEASINGWISTSADSCYKEGVKTSITLWLPTWSTAITTYLAASGMNWDNNQTFDEKMEKIHLEKYYALFLNDMQQWFEYRRTGHPILPKGAGLRNNGVMPARMTYPVYVQSTNPTNYRLAVEAQGPDAISTQVWWQKP